MLVFIVCGIMGYMCQQRGGGGAKDWIGFYWIFCATLAFIVKCHEWFKAVFFDFKWVLQSVQQ